MWICKQERWVMVPTDHHSVVTQINDWVQFKFSMSAHVSKMSLHVPNALILTYISLTPSFNNSFSLQVWKNLHVSASQNTNADFPSSGSRNNLVQTLSMFSLSLHPQKRNDDRPDVKLQSNMGDDIQHKECDPRQSGKALQSCCTTAALCKMMSSTRHVRNQALLLLLLGLEHFCTKMMTGNGITWPVRTTNSLLTPKWSLKGENTTQTSLEI